MFPDPGAVGEAFVVIGLEKACKYHKMFRTLNFHMSFPVTVSAVDQTLALFMLILKNKTRRNYTTLIPNFKVSCVKVSFITWPRCLQVHSNMFSIQGPVISNGFFFGDLCRNFPICEAWNSEMFQSKMRARMQLKPVPHFLNSFIYESSNGIFK